MHMVEIWCEKGRREKARQGEARQGGNMRKLLFSHRRAQIATIRHARGGARKETAIESDVKQKECVCYLTFLKIGGSVCCVCMRTFKWFALLYINQRKEISLSPSRSERMLQTFRLGCRFVLRIYRTFQHQTPNFSGRMIPLLQRRTYRHTDR